MADNHQYRFSRGKDSYIVFDSRGYVVEAKGFGNIMWSSDLNIDKELVGKHVDELAELIKKNGISYNEYLEFEAHVHVGLLKELLQNSNQ